MEIQNTQSGQAFASTSTLAPVRNDSPLTSEQSSNRSEQQPGDQNQFANSVKQVQVEAAAVGEKNISQASGEQVDNKDVERNGEQLDEAIAKVESFSVHADSNELLAWLKQAKAPKQSFIVHGELQGQQRMQERLTGELGWKATIPKSGQVFQV